MQTIGQQVQMQKDRHAGLRLEADVRRAARRGGATEEQQAALVAKVREVFVIADGQARPMLADGKTEMRRADGWFVTVEEWVASMLPAKNAPGPRLPVPKKNPFLREFWNLTEQMRIQRQDPALAARLREAY
jgi:hypothetical protein